MLHPSFPVETERLLLRPYGDDDAEALYAMQRRPDVTRYLYWEPRSRADVRRMLERRKPLMQLEHEGDGLMLAAILRTTGALIGDVSLRWLSQEHRQGEIGFAFHPDHQGRGYATEAAMVMLRLGFRGLDLHRIIGRCDARNTPSARVLERLGMRREAHLVENEFVKGEWCSEFVYAILADEWTARSGAPAA